MEEELYDDILLLEAQCNRMLVKKQHQQVFDKVLNVVQQNKLPIKLQQKVLEIFSKINIEQVNQLQIKKLIEQFEASVIVSLLSQWANKYKKLYHIQYWLGECDTDQKHISQCQQAPFVIQNYKNNKQHFMNQLCNKQYKNCQEMNVHMPEFLQLTFQAVMQQNYNAFMKIQETYKEKINEEGLQAQYKRLQQEFQAKIIADELD